MSVRNQNWYNLQATRRYPLDENSTGLDDENQFIRDDILADCHIRFPSTYGKYVYVQGLTVSPGIVTVVFGVSGSDGFVAGEPMAAVSLPRPVTPNVNYAITPIKPGVSGWVAFAHGVDTLFTGRYTTVQQTLISPRCARSYKPLPVPTIGKLGLAEALQGVVRLVGQLPVRVRYDSDAGRVVSVAGGEKTVRQETTKALVIELDPAQITERYNPLQLFLGPCGQRPESGTCPKTPIENINGVAPDCNGNIEVVFENFDGAQLFATCGGTDIISDNDLPIICDATKRKRPETYQDDCCVAGFEVPSASDLSSFPVELRTAGMIVRTIDTNERWQLAADLVTWDVTNSADYCNWPDPTDVIPDIIIDEVLPDTNYPPVTLPACVDFQNCDGATKFTVRSGAFNTTTLASPAACPSCLSADLDADEINSGGTTLTPKTVYVAVATASLNLATFNNSATDWSINTTISTELRIGTSGIERVGGIVLNYQTSLNAADQVQTTFVAVVLDASRGQLRVLRYTNNSVTVESTANMLIKTGSWYRLMAIPVLNGNSIAVSAYAEELTTVDPATASTVVQIDSDSYGALVGAAGLIAPRSFTYFNKFAIVAQS